MIEAGLAGWLRLSVLDVENRVYPQRIAPVEGKVSYPAIWYAMVSDPRVFTHDGSTGLVEARYQITVVDTSYENVKEIASDVRAALDGLDGALGEGVTVEFVQYMGGRDLFDPDTRAHFIPMDFRFQYREA